MHTCTFDKYTQTDGLSFSINTILEIQEISVKKNKWKWKWKADQWSKDYKCNVIEDIYNRRHTLSHTHIRILATLKWNKMLVQFNLKHTDIHQVDMLHSRFILYTFCRNWKHNSFPQNVPAACQVERASQQNKGRRWTTLKERRNGKNNKKSNKRRCQTIQHIYINIFSLFFI